MILYGVPSTQLGISETCPGSHSKRPSVFEGEENEQESTVLTRLGRVHWVVTPKTPKTTLFGMPADPPCPARNVPKVENIGLFGGIFDQKYAARAVPLCNPIPRWPVQGPFDQKNAARGVLHVRTNLVRLGTLKPSFQVLGSQSARMTPVLTRFR